jgi:hypothetical protein
MTIRRLLLALLLSPVMDIRSAAGFAPSRQRRLVFARTDKHRANLPKTTLRMADEVDDEKLSITSKEVEAPLAAHSKLPSPPKEKKLDPVQIILRFMDDVYNVVILATGSFFAIGILLNLCGYGYKFTKDGFRVDTVEVMRMENQFERAAREMAIESRPPSSLPK